MRRLLSLLLILLLCAGCVAGPAMYLEDCGESYFSGVCEKYSGQQRHALTLGENACVNLRCIIERKDGTLDVSVNGAESFSHEGLRENIELVFQLTEPGDYTILVDAKGYSGSFRFEWETVGAAP